VDRGALPLASPLEGSADREPRTSKGFPCGFLWGARQNLEEFRGCAFLERVAHLRTAGTEDSPISFRCWQTSQRFETWAAVARAVLNRHAR
jgi:hypothetical protein